MKERLAIEGGKPVRTHFLPYGHQYIDENDIRAVEKVLRSNWLTTGPTVVEFENSFAEYVGANGAVSFCNGTAALHASINALKIGPGDEVIVPTMTFASTANSVVFQGATPIFVDVDSSTLLIDPGLIEEKITPRTKAIIAVDYAGQPCEYDEINRIAFHYGIKVVSDSCHSLGGYYKETSVGNIADLNTFSFHPVKSITTGEGGMVSTKDNEILKRLKAFRNHGISRDYSQRQKEFSWVYEIKELGYNYRLSEIQCALGLNQLKKLPEFIIKRQAIADQYSKAFAQLEIISPLFVKPFITHAYHLYVVLLNLSKIRVSRAAIFAALQAEGIGVNVHYIPVHLHPYYRNHFGTGPGLCPVAEMAYERLISLPIWPGMTAGDVQDTVTAVQKVIEAYKK